MGLEAVIPDLSQLVSRMTALEAVGLTAAGLAGIQTALGTIPQPATAAPPIIADSSAVGASPRYALADHTHTGNSWAGKITVSGGSATWTFGDLGFTPVVEATAETPSGAAYINVAAVQAGSVTSTTAVITVAQIPKTITLPGVALSLLGLVLNISTAAPNGVVVHVLARKANA